MSIEKRRYIRFSLDIPINRFTEDGNTVQTFMRQVSVGGCLTDWEESMNEGDEFRIEIQLPNKNKLPIQCKAIYKYTGRGMGIKFQDVSQFEQELIAQIISENLESEGLPVLVDPFTMPPKFIGSSEDSKELKDEINNLRMQNNKVTDKVLSH